MALLEMQKQMIEDALKHDSQLDQIFSIAVIVGDEDTVKYILTEKFQHLRADTQALAKQSGLFEEYGITVQ